MGKEALGNLFCSSMKLETIKRLAYEVFCCIIVRNGNVDFEEETERYNLECSGVDTEKN